MCYWVIVLLNAQFKLGVLVRACLLSPITTLHPLLLSINTCFPFNLHVWSDYWKICNKSIHPRYLFNSDFTVVFPMTIFSHKKLVACDSLVIICIDIDSLYLTFIDFNVFDIECIDIDCGFSITFIISLWRGDFLKSFNFILCL